ncbi:lipoprotein, partial [Spiroplasma endosymbiont of Megaselia nigra]|uniref:lipoprotein n=1 Tax=Spiroplasma endosymbiont of Megaselia nigra TaxID=2478537 RepID=UPI000F98C5E7
MKKWLSILGIIGLTATSTTTLISCEKPNNKNIPCEKQNHGNWKQQCSNEKPFNTVDNKYYIIVWRSTSNSKWNINGFD